MARLYKGVVCISDSQFTYTYMVEADADSGNIRMYFPEFAPEAYGKYPKYLLSIAYFDGAQQQFTMSASFDRSVALACAPIRYERDIYYEYVDLINQKQIPTGIDRLFVSLTPVVGKDLLIDMDYNAGQSALVNHTEHLGAKFTVDQNSISIKPTINLSNAYLSNLYGDSQYFVQYHMFLADDKKIYEAIESNIYPVDSCEWQASITDDVLHQFSNGANVETSHERWVPGLKLTGTIVIFKKIKDATLEADEPLDLSVEGIGSTKAVKFAGLMADPLPITQELYAQWCYGFNKKINLDDMEIIQPRIINKTVMEVHEITAKTDPHANIVKPIFFRTRELANIVIHPEVTENICINLDAYKSQCDAFMLKIEGILFGEFARVESGVVFKIRGNQLPGDVERGTYYILNQDAELITTGKFFYER